MQLIADCSSQRGPQPNRLRAGFTLVELLVVVTIIALLIAILLPDLRNARMQARIVRTHGDLRQITVALDSYMLVNNEQLPPTRFACGTSTNYQLPIELATDGYFAPSPKAIPQADFADHFDPVRTYRYVAPGPMYQNGTFFDEPNKPWKPRAKIWIPDDFPDCRAEEGAYQHNYSTETPSPVSYAIWSIGPDKSSPKFPRGWDGVTVDEARFPLPRKFWLLNSGDTGLITHFRTRRGLVLTSP